MKEEDRLIVVERIKRNLEERKELEVKEERLNELKNNPLILEYLQLVKDVSRISSNKRMKPNESDLIYSEFSNEFSLANVKRQEDTPCKHEIWVCIGAFYEEYNPVGGRSYLKLHNNLEQDNFAYNGYVCIECGRTVYTKKWQEFESKHFVLKNLYDERTYQYYMENNSCYYRDLYYQLLFTNPVEVAQQKVISEFNKNMEKTKVLKKES